MTRQKAYLLLTALFTLMFIVLILLGAYLLSIHSKQFAVAAFLFAFAAVFTQIGSLALYIRHKSCRNRSSIRPNVPSRTIPLLKMPWPKHAMPPNTAAYRHLPTTPASAPTP